MESRTGREMIVHNHKNPICFSSCLRKLLVYAVLNNEIKYHANICLNMVFFFCVSLKDNK